MQNIFLVIRQKCKINRAHFRPGDLLYYSLCQNNNTFRAWSSLFRKHTPSKVLMNKYNANILSAWTRFFHKHAPACFQNFENFCFLIPMKHDVAWRGESSKRTSDSPYRSTTFVFLKFFLLIFSQDRLMILFQWNF